MDFEDRGAAADVSGVQIAVLESATAAAETVTASTTPYQRRQHVRHSQINA